MDLGIHCQAFVRGLKLTLGESTTENVVFYIGDIFVHSNMFGKYLKPYLSASDVAEDLLIGVK
jgi:hypothetical protein